MKSFWLLKFAMIAIVSTGFCAEESVQTHEVQKGTLFERILELNKIQEPELDVDAARNAFKDLANSCRESISKMDEPTKKVSELIRVVLKERKVSYLSNIYWRDATLSASLLRKSGNCLATSMLLTCVGDVLDLPIHLVRAPDHAFVRWDDGKAYINIETTIKEGPNYSDLSYLNTKDGILMLDLMGQHWLMSLNTDECYGHSLEIVSNFLRGQGKLAEAQRTLIKASTLMPFRADLHVSRFSLEADLSGNRKQAIEGITMLLKDKNSAPYVRVKAALWLAAEAACQRDYIAEREYLLTAFADATKSLQPGVLRQLAGCYRSNKDYRSALRYAELAAAIDKHKGAKGASMLSKLAVHQYEDGEKEKALVSVEEGLRLNPESWLLQIQKSAYIYKLGQKDQAQELFSKVTPPREAPADFHKMRAWFYIRTDNFDSFYDALGKALSYPDLRDTLLWIDQDPELEKVRSDIKFQKLVEEARKRFVTQRESPLKVDASKVDEQN